MVGVGIVSSMIGGRAIWTVPGMFVAAMAVGALLGRFEGSLSETVIEVGIAVSVVPWSPIAGEGRVPTAVIAGAVLFFGFFHGYAHGTEIPDVARPAMYAFGFLIGTAPFTSSASSQARWRSGTPRVPSSSVASASPSPPRPPDTLRVI